MKEHKKSTSKKTYMGFAAAILALELLGILLCVAVYKREEQEDSRLYRVEAERVAQELRNIAAKTNAQAISDGADTGMSVREIAASVDLSKYESIVRVSAFQDPSGRTADEYIVAEAAGALYCIEYTHLYERRASYFIFVLAAAAVFAFTGIILWYVWKKILKPFHNISELPAELAKGNLSMPVHEEKSKYFGRFLWGMDMLREKLEADRCRELELQKEKQTLLLSLSHDIKTPLSAIELYAKALSEHLYDSKEKQAEALQGITRNATDIQKYIDEIVKASKEDFLHLEVKSGEFYLSDALQGPENYYRDKLSVLHTDFEVAPIKNCLMKGDLDRVIEILQNLMENAIKYGDGKFIRISDDEEEDCRLITVENSGCTLKSEELPHLFDPFYRGSNSSKVNGSGLGLYICRNLIRKMDGDIYVRLDGDVFKATVVVRKAQ